MRSVKLSLWKLQADQLERVAFLAPDNGEDITVVAIGPSVHPDLPVNLSVSSSKTEGFQGKVTAEIEDGVVVGLAGNGIEFGSPLTPEHLQTVKAYLDQEDRKPSERVRVISKVRRTPR